MGPVSCRTNLRAKLEVSPSLSTLKHTFVDKTLMHYWKQSAKGASFVAHPFTMQIFPVPLDFNILYFTCRFYLYLQILTLCICLTQYIVQILDNLASSNLFFRGFNVHSQSRCPQLVEARFLPQLCKLDTLIKIIIIIIIIMIMIMIMISNQ